MATADLDPGAVRRITLAIRHLSIASFGVPTVLRRGWTKKKADFVSVVVGS